MIKFIKAETYEEMGKIAGEIMWNQVKEKETCVLGLATGSTPLSTYDYLAEKCKEDKDGSIKFNVTNDIYLPFTKSEIEEYITNTEKKVLVYGDVRIRLGREKVGAGIQIVPK